MMSLSANANIPGFASAQMQDYLDRVGSPVSGLPGQGSAVLVPSKLLKAYFGVSAPLYLYYRSHGPVPIFICHIGFVPEIKKRKGARNPPIHPGITQFLRKTRQCHLLSMNNP